ncbi:hypothetical protein O3M35_001096 [Rhynocoris fuscipes]|uniref:CHK kinase-like domain-containing protein n=1 Tax=Rhynocoris fuscipes TaxID=488301 RepID=A0AAW1DSV8_9HEMI
MDKQCLERIMKQCSLNETSISHIENIQYEPAVAKGENYASVILRYRITVQLTNGEKEVKYVIVKTVPECEKEAAFCTETPVFKNEIFMYAVVLKEMEKLMKEFNDTRDKLWADLVGYRNNDVVMVDDLSRKQFVVMDRREMLDFEHSQLAIKALARFHAMSAVLLKRNIIKATDFKTLLFVSSEKMINLFFVCFFNTFGDVVKKHWGSEWSYLPEHLYNAAKSSVERCSNMVKLEKSRFNVINHGDCWTNNIMFKHRIDNSGNKIPIAIRLIDLQMGHCNSFAWDLTYFFYNSIRPDIRRSRYFDLLSIYHKTLKEFLGIYSYPMDEIPTLDCVINEMQRLKFFGISLLISIQAFTSTEVPDSYDLFLAYANHQNPASGININIFNTESFRNKVEEDLKAFVKEGII